MDINSDIELINGCILNSRKYQELLYRRFFQKMYAMCLRHSRDETIAMTIVHDGFMKVYKNIKKYEQKGSFEGWIRKLMYHCICDYYRKQKTKPRMIELNNDRAIDADIYQKMSYEEILKKVELLSPATKEVFVKYAIEGFKHREISEKLGISESTSKWHLANARNKLQELLKGHEGEFNMKRHG